ncbi:MAG: DUF4135 domain-containing protein [Gemmatimonadota bacterium]
MAESALTDPAVRRALGSAAPVGRSTAFAPDERPQALVVAATRARALAGVLGPAALARLGVSDEDLGALVGPVVLRDGAELPGWAGILVAAIDWWSTAEQPSWGGLARALVDDALGGLAVAFGPQARSAVAVQALAHGAPSQDPRTLLLQFPARAYAAAHQIDRTLANTIEFAARLERDREDVAQLIGAPADSVADLTLACGDPHDGLRSVSIVAFASGARVVYKTKDLRVQRLWNDVVALVDGDFTSTLGFAGPRELPLVVREDHVWVRLVEQDPARDDPAATARFMARMGGLAAVAALLRANDLWGDNLVTVGDQPFIIDVEAMLVPPFPGPDDLPALASGLVAMSLPVHPDQPAAALGALTFDAAIASGIEAPDEQGRRGSGYDTVTHTDGDGRAWVSMVMDERRPTIDGLPPDLFAWWPEFASGYRCASRGLVRRAASLHALLDGHADDRSRMIVQGTFDYYRAMYASWNGAYDGDTRRRTLALIRTMKAWHRGRLLEVPALAWVEGVMLADGDIPYVTTRADSPDLFAGGRSLGAFGTAAGLDAVRDRVDEPPDPEDDLGALRAHASTDVADQALPVAVAGAVPRSRPPAPPAPASFAEHAQAIGAVVEDWLRRDRSRGVVEQPEIALRAYGIVPVDVWSGAAAAAERAAQVLQHAAVVPAAGPRPPDGLGDTAWSMRVLAAAGAAPQDVPVAPEAAAAPYWGRQPTALVRRGLVVDHDVTRLRTAELIALGEAPGCARAAASELTARHAATGRWLGDRLADDGLLLSGVWGLVGVGRTLLRADGHDVPALRDAYRAAPPAAAPPRGVRSAVVSNDSHARDGKPG